MSLRRSKGFTLVELMVTIAVVAILGTIAYPSFQSTIRSNRVAASQNELLGVLNLARSDAVRNNRGGGVCGSSSGTSCDGGWATGIMAFADSNGDGAFQNTETVLRYFAVTNGLTVSGPDALIAFDARGRRRAGADQVVTIQPAQCGSGTLRRAITVNASGQIKTAREACK